MSVGKTPSRFYNLILNGVILVFVAVLLIFSIFLVRTKLLQNTQSMGMALVHSYALEEEMIEPLDAAYDHTFGEF